ncbi:MAG: sensor histidine kinase [bacterium]|nr:sensor histidine kinase [bacterium]
MSVVILPGLIISALGIYLVSQQKSARLLEVRQEFAGRMNRLRDSLETDTGQQMDAVFRQFETETGNVNVNRDEPDRLPGLIKTLMLRHPLMKYPFIISSAKGFLFPGSRKAEFPALKSPALELETVTGTQRMERLYRDGYGKEYRERNFVSAIKAYLGCLEEKPAAHTAPYILNSIARCYYKLNRFPQAIHYYLRTYNRHLETLKKDRFLYFTIIRQLAAAYKQLDYTGDAVKWYLLLYEEIPREEVPGEGSPFAFYKNEALDYLNRNARGTESAGEASRFSRARARDRLEDASPLDVSLQWDYYVIGTADASGNSADGGGGRESRFLKLREFFESDDEKALFYKFLDTSGQWKGTNRGSASPSPSVNYLKHPVSGNSYTVCYKTVYNNHPRWGTVYFGFVLAYDHVKSVLLPRLADRQLDEAGVFADLHEDEKPGLISVALSGLFPGKTLTLYSSEENFFETVVRGNIRLYYVLLGALMLTLTLGIFLFYKYLSRERELVRLKADFVDSASHTLKTPLTRMSLLAENAARGWVTDESQKQQFFDTIVAETSRMSEMIDNMLNFSRIEAGKQRYEPETLSLQEEVVSVIDFYSRYAGSLGFQLETAIDEDLPPLLLDRKAARLIIANLLQNAVKYCAEEKNIKVRLYREKEQAVLEVEDRGIGIASKDIPLLFKRFSRIPDDRVNATEGSGLGLFLVHHAVEAHNGHIDVISTVGKGTTFRVYFPFNTK